MRDKCKQWKQKTNWRNETWLRVKKYMQHMACVFLFAYISMYIRKQHKINWKLFESTKYIMQCYIETYFNKNKFSGNIFREVTRKLTSISRKVKQTFIILITSKKWIIRGRDWVYLTSSVLTYDAKILIIFWHKRNTRARFSRERIN